MLISQFQNIARMVGQADQKVGKDAVDRYNDLMKELRSCRRSSNNGRLDDLMI